MPFSGLADNGLFFLVWWREWVRSIFVTGVDWYKHGGETVLGWPGTKRPAWNCDLGLFRACRFKNGLEADANQLMLKASIPSSCLEGDP